MSETPPKPAVPEAPEPRVEVGKAITWAFDRFRSNAVAFIALAAVVTVIQVIAQVGTGPLQRIVTDCSDALSPGQVNACSAAVGTYAIVSIAIALVFSVLAFFAQIGVQRAAIRNTQGVPPTFASMLTTQHLGKYVLYTIVWGIAIGIGLILCLLPGLLVLFFFQLGPYYILDKGMGIRDAARASFRAVKSNVGPAFLMTIFYWLLMLLTTVLFGVLTLVVLPIANLFTAHMYRQLNGEPVR